jgi:hypothetical protein
MVPANMLTGIQGINGDAVKITIARGDVSALSDEMKAHIGSRPLIQLTLTVDGVQSDWYNPNAPVTVSIPYIPTSEELATPESIVIWYIDGSGKAVCVPNGHYDPANNTVMFKTTHFSFFAVGYQAIGQTDDDAAWYSQAVRFVSARGIAADTGHESFVPEGNLTRGQLLVMLMKAYGIAPDTALSENFSDAGNTYYTGYLAAAKRLGITSGTGNNTYEPERTVSRQEMFTLLYNILRQAGSLPAVTADVTPGLFNDAGTIADWAMDAAAWLANSGLINGFDGNLNPTRPATIAEMAQILYNLITD